MQPERCPAALGAAADPLITALDAVRLAARLMREHGGEAGVAFAARVAEWEGDALGTLRLDVALGVRTDAADDARKRVRRADRDRLIRAAAARFFGSLSTRQQAVRLRQAIARYAAAGWVRDRRWRLAPPRLAGTVEAFAFEILKRVSDVPAFRKFQEILAAPMACVCGLHPLVTAHHRPDDIGRGDSHGADAET